MRSPRRAPVGSFRLWALALLPALLSCQLLVKNLLPGCGDGLAEEGEQCDDGNNADGDGCSAACTLEGEPFCGDGSLDEGEECDDGNLEGGDGCNKNCQLEGDRVCGNGIIEENEQCDPPDGISCGDDCQIIESCDTGDCANCQICSFQGTCASQAFACQANPACQDFQSCALNCQGDLACQDSCAQTNPDGAELFNDLTICIVCEACPDSCQGAQVAGCP